MEQAADDTGHARPPPQYSDMSTVVLFGKNSDFKKMIGNIIIGNDIWNVQSFNGFTVEKNGTFKIVITPDFEESLDIHQEIIDLMALSHPDPSLFILAVDPEHSREEEVVAQIGKLQTMLGDHITGHLAVVTHNVEIYYSLQRLKELFNIHLVSASENLPGDCQRWYSDRQQFQFDYKHSRDLVMRRRKCLDSMSFRKDHPSQHGHVTAAVKL
uniref:uncharacterized protein LOC109974217 n=1 Tax=Monopterus albus TaxID=43700 RepID=UPI0009B39317|nr:uncharacterized protein LOC109974217 [Monopterus albus]